MKKKGDLSINLIIVAAIAMIVLLVVVLIFTGRFGIFRRGTENCLTLGGTCVANADECTGDYSKVNPSGKCGPGPDNKENTRDDEVCCLRS